MANAPLEITRFRPGVALSAYLRKNWPGPAPTVGQLPPPGEPAGQATVDGTGLALLSLPENERYYVGGFQDGVWRWVNASTETGLAGSAETARAEAAEAVLRARIEELRNEAPGTSRLIFGINSNLAAGHAAEWTASRIYGDRSNNLDVKYDTAAATVSTAVAASLAAGCKYPLPIINTPDSTVLGTVGVEAYANGALAIIERVFADHPTVKTFELVNEPYYKASSPHGSKVGANASTYGNLVRATYEKVKAAGLLSQVSLLVSAFGEYHTLSSEVEQKQSEPAVFKHWVDDICTQMSTPWGMVVGGQGYGSYPVADETLVERQEAFQFTCRRSGPVSELRLRTNSTANTGVSSVVLGLAADSAGKPGAILGQATASGEPSANSWVTVTLPEAISVVNNTKYWLVLLPLGTAGKHLHYNVASTLNLGTGDVESGEGKTFKKIEALASGEWETFNQGSVLFQAGTELTRSLAADINGWSNHPYGNLGVANGEGNFNWGSTEGFRTKVSSNGAGGNSNWWLTEFGWQGESTQNGNMLGFLEKSLAARTAGWLTAIYEYDDGDGEWTIHGRPAGQTYKTFASQHG